MLESAPDRIPTCPLGDTHRIVLRVASGPHTGQQWIFRDAARLTLGRSARADLRLAQEPALSAIHCQLELAPPDVKLVDLGSRNGTQVNGAIVAVADLRDGDQFGIASTRLQVSIVSQAAEPPPPPAGSPAALAAPELNLPERLTARLPDDVQPVGDLIDQKLGLDSSRYWLASLLLHLVLLLGLALMVIRPPQSPTTLMLSMESAVDDSYKDLDLIQFASLEPPPMDAEAVPEEAIQEVPSIDLVQPELTPLDSFDKLPDLGALASELERELMVDPDMLGPLSEAIGKELQDAALNGMLRGRSGKRKQELLQQYGGTAATEAAVEAGLRWLSKQQRADGSWSLQGPYSDGGIASEKVGATALALLAYLGAGHTHFEGNYTQEVGNAIRWLVQHQSATGQFFPQQSHNSHRAYAHAQATIAICELYVMTQDSWLREPAHRAIQFALSLQCRDGGWRYTLGQGTGDLSMTGWYLMGLVSGAAAGYDVPRKVLRRVETFVDSVSHADASQYGYLVGRLPSKSMTAEGLLCRQFLGWQRQAPPLVQGANLLVSPTWLMNVNQGDVYYWYYATQVLHHQGGSPWDTWNGVMRELLPSLQVAQGDELGSWDPLQNTNKEFVTTVGGRLYMTCLSLYCLEVYYRHMPLYDLSD